MRSRRGARARLGKILSQHKPDVSIIELGGNDGLRGLSLEEISANLEMIINNLVEINSCVLLVPMRLPPNYGQVYNDRFAAVFNEIADKQDIILTEFILQDIADKPDLMQSDGIHPLAEAQELMLDLIWLSLEPKLQKD